MKFQILAFFSQSHCLEIKYGQTKAIHFAIKISLNPGAKLLISVTTETEM